MGVQLLLMGLLGAGLAYFIRWVQAEAGPDFWGGPTKMPLVRFFGNLLIGAFLALAALGLVVSIAEALPA